MKAVITDWYEKELFPSMNLDADGEGVAGRFDVSNVRNKILHLADDLRNRQDSRTTKIISGETEEEAIQTLGPIDSQQPENSKKYPNLSHTMVSLLFGRLTSLRRPT